MQLTDYTDYTLRVLIFLALHPGQLVTIQQIADGYGISKNHLMKIVNQLSQQGLVVAVRGRHGGVRLGRAPESITIGAVIRSTETDFDLVECFDKVNNRCVLSPACRLQHAIREALDAFFRTLDAVTLADVVSNPSEVRALVVEPPSLPQRRLQAR